MENSNQTEPNQTETNSAELNGITATTTQIYIRTPSFISIKNVNDEIIMKQNDWK